MALVLAGVSLAMLAFPAAAHPLGSSTNVYIRILLAPGTAHLRFVLDVSEQIAVAEQRFADLNSDKTVDAAESKTYLDGLWVYLQPKISVALAGQPVTWVRDDQELTFPPGQGGLPLLRAVFNLSAAMPPASGTIDGSITETTFDGLPGWHEIIVQADPGVTIVTSSVPAVDLTNELRSYPADRLSDPLVVRSATFSFTAPGPASASPVASGAGGSPGASSSGAPPATPAATVLPPSAGASPPPDSRPTDPLVNLAGGRLDAVAGVLAVLFALGLGALHALSPGHGKTIVAAYLIGTRADFRKAIWLGLTVAVTHTAGVFLLGAATYVATEWIVPTRIVGWLSVATGALVVVLGVMLIWRTRAAFAGRGHTHDHGHSHGHDHSHGHTHPHEPPARKRSKSKNAASAAAAASAASAARAAADVPARSTTPDLRHRDVAALGVMGGLVPSGSALLLLLSSIALDRVAFGIVLLLAFGVGMAIVLVAITMSVVLVRGTRVASWERWRDPRIARLIPLVPMISGVVVLAFGAILTVQAITEIR